MGRKPATLWCILFLVWGLKQTFCNRPHCSRLAKTVLHGKAPQPPELSERLGDPPVETGRNPQAVALDFIWGLVGIPLAVFGAVALYFLSTVLNTVSQPPPSVPLTEALSALVAIEDDYAVRGPNMGLRQRLSRWFQWSEPKRRLDFELAEVKSSSSREVIRKRGMDAAEDIASAVEYYMAGNGVMEDSGCKSSRLF